MFEILPIILPHAFQFIGVLFAVVFMVILLIILLKGINTIDVRDLFSSAADGGTSLTKFWQNVAYAAATIAFLAINITGQVSGASLEIIWLIYLAVVASNAVLSKWISVKYNRTEEKKNGDDWFISRPPPRYNRRDDPYAGSDPSRDGDRVDNPDRS